MTIEIKKTENVAIIDGIEYNLVKKELPIDYEIQSFRNKKSKEIDDISKKRSIVKDNWWLDNTNLYEIYSVKRLSDGEIFTIGDSMNYKKEIFFPNSSCIIAYFSIYKDKIYVNSHHAGNPQCSIKDWIKQKKLPLFTTEDGVDIFERDSYWLIDMCSGTPHLKYWDAKVMESYEKNLFYLNDKKKFSSKEKAEKYIELNKKVYSKKDILDIIERTGIDCLLKEIEKL